MKYNLSGAISEMKRDPCLKLNFNKVKNDYNSFKFLINFRKKNQYNNTKQIEYLQKLYKARMIFDRNIILFKSFFDPTINIYIEKAEGANDAYKNLSTHLGIASGNLDIIQNDFKMIEQQSGMNYIENPSALLKIAHFRESLTSHYESLIIFSLVNAYNIFKEFEETTELKKDRLLFSWFLFREISKSAEYFGSLARQMAFSDMLAKLKGLENSKLDATNVSSTPNIKKEAEKPIEISQLKDPFAEVDYEI